MIIRSITELASRLSKAPPSYEVISTAWIINKELSKYAGFEARLPRSITIVLELGLWRCPPPKLHCLAACLLWPANWYWWQKCLSSDRGRRFQPLWSSEDETQVQLVQVCLSTKWWWVYICLYQVQTCSICILSVSVSVSLCLSLSLSCSLFLCSYLINGVVILPGRSRCPFAVLILLTALWDSSIQCDLERSLSLCTVRSAVRRYWLLQPQCTDEVDQEGWIVLE